MVRPAAQWCALPAGYLDRLDPAGWHERTPFCRNQLESRKLPENAQTPTTCPGARPGVGPPAPTHEVGTECTLCWLARVQDSQFSNQISPGVETKIRSPSVGLILLPLCKCNSIKFVSFGNTFAFRHVPLSIFSCI